MSTLIRERFSKPADEFAAKFVASVEADEKLIPFDIQGSIAHAMMLEKQGLIEEKDLIGIVAGLEQLQREHRLGRLKLDVADEDVHMNVEKRLIDMAGKIGERLHTARSRNDQVALDLRLWLKNEISEIMFEIAALKGSLRKQAKEHAETILPGVTHLQHAQPVVFGHVLLSFYEALERDKGRLADCLKRVDVSPLGACALAGTSLPIDPKVTAKSLGFSKVFANSIDAVSDRDFAAEFVFSCSLLAVHLSQIAENLILWSTPEFEFIELPDELCTSSSIMPQKKNADMIELVRGKAGSVIGQLINLLVTLKGLPSGYNRDLQETKPPVFEAAETARLSLRAIRLAVDGMVVDKEMMLLAANDPQLLATDLAEYLVKKGAPFREAHGAIARLMKHCAEKSVSPINLTTAELQAFHSSFERDVYDLLTPQASVAGKKSSGGTAPENVEKRVTQLSKGEGAKHD